MFSYIICSVSSLAWFMSNQETSFVTIGQRVLARPLKYVPLYIKLILLLHQFQNNIFSVCTFINSIQLTA